MPVSRGRKAPAQPKPRRGSPAAVAARDQRAAARRTASSKHELKPWQLAVYIVLGLAVAGAALGLSYSSRSNSEWGQYPWARTAVPPKVWYAKHHYKPGGSASTAGWVKVGRTPGGGVIKAAGTTKNPAPTSVEVGKTADGPFTQYQIIGSP